MIDDMLDRDIIAQIFSLADVYVTASRVEGWGMSVQQAAASKCAVVSSDYVPFVTEVLKDSSKIIHTHDASDYTKAMQKMAYPKTLQKHKKEAYKRVKNAYTWLSLTKTMMEGAD